jgi:subtilisin-like proprotein convertase family protein
MTRKLARAGIAATAVFGVLAMVGTPALAKTTTKTKTVTQCVDANAPIGEQSLASAVLNVAVPKNGKKVQSGVVTTAQAGTRITFPNDADLNLTLVSPGGKAISLAAEDFSGSPAVGYGTGAAGCGGSLVQFGDTFPTSITAPGNADGDPIVGQFMPRQPLAAFNGGPARGAWTLLVANCCTGDTGTLNAFSLNLTYQYKAPAKKKKKK